MKKQIGILGLALASLSCQHQAAPLTAAPAVVLAAAKLPVVVAQPPATAAVVDTLPASKPTGIQDYDLTNLWANQEAAAPQATRRALEGFYGADHYRISFVFTSIRRDSLNPALYHVTGKNRYKKTVTSFFGTLQVRRIAQLTSAYLSSEYPADKCYSANAHFIFWEDAAQASSGVFEGTGLLDFCISPQGDISQISTATFENLPAKGQGVLFKGNWTHNKTGQRRQVLFAQDVFRIAPEVLRNFAIGQREPDVNPKYAKLGWNSYWQNDEWWADAGGPSPLF